MLNNVFWLKHVDVNLSISTILGVCMGKSGVESHNSVGAEGLGVKGIMGQKEPAQGGEPDAVQRSGQYENIP